MDLLSIVALRRRWAAFLWLCLLSASGRAQQPLINQPLLLPSAIAFDAQGNLYIVETANHVIRRIDNTGNITTVAGTGIQGYGGDGGAASAAILDSPQGLVLDATNLYIADTHNHRIRRVNLSTGTISTFAGSSIAGSSGDNGSASSATLDRPVALALDNKGDLYIADSGSHRIRRIDAASGWITTVAGVGTQGYDGDNRQAASALLDSPQGLAVDANGNLYIADTHNHRIRRIDTTGMMTTVAGTGAFGYAGDSGAAASARLALPQGITIDSEGNLYLADSANHRIRRVDGISGVITTLAGDGTQDFAGDNGTSVSASLNTPHAVALSPAGLVTVADTSNQRVRQISGTSIQTIVGLGAANSVTLSLSGSASVAYGSGSIVAALSSTNASGNVVFTDSSGATTTVPLSSSGAVFDTSTLSAGQHTIVASYGGDATHLAAQSTPFSLAITPLSITAIISPASLSYGEPVPVFIGSLSGLLSRDRANVSAAFAVDAPADAPVGSYPVKVTLNGSAAGNYIIATLPTLTITKARTAVALKAATAALGSATNADAGQTVLFTAHVTSVTTGAPTGIISIYDGGTLLAAGSPDSSGNMTFAAATLGSGPHSLNATYSGDSNFLSSTSPTVLFTVNVPAGYADFTLAPSGGTTQTIVAGGSANYSFAVQVQGNLSSSITLAASGLPDMATASFNPGTIVPGSSSASFTMTIATQKSTALFLKTKSFVFASLLPFVFLLRKRPKRSIQQILLFLLVSVPLFSLAGCGDRVRTGGTSATTTKTYTVTVTGTATTASGSALQHTATVTLVVQSAS